MGFRSMDKIQPLKVIQKVNKGGKKQNILGEQ